MRACLVLAGWCWSLSLLSAQAEMDRPLEVDRWVRSRALEYKAFLTDPSAGRSLSAAPLWQERVPRPGREVTRPSFSAVVRAVRPGVVNIATSPDTKGGKPSQGSGFLISPDGYVVTSNHLVEGAAGVWVKLEDGRRLPAQIVGKDPLTDLALARLSSPPPDLPFLFLGDSDKLEVGDWVLAIGNPFGLGHSVAHGIVSAKERTLGGGMFDEFLQTDVALNPGNSGGPLFDLNGDVVGVNTAVAAEGKGIGFAVPINLVKALLPNLEINGRLERGWLGITIAEPRAEGAGHPEAGVVVVEDVYAGSPAARAGLVGGDRIVAVDGKTADSYLQLLRRIALLGPGSPISLTIRRGDRTVQPSLRLGTRPPPRP